MNHQHAVNAFDIPRTRVKHIHQSYNKVICLKHATSTLTPPPREKVVGSNLISNSQTLDYFLSVYL